MRKLPDYLKENPLHTHTSRPVIIESCDILEVSSVGALTQFCEILQKFPVLLRKEHPVVFIHLGVNTGTTVFNLEMLGANEANFRIPDQRGWQPQKISIHPDHPDIKQTLQTTLPLDDLMKLFEEKNQFPVVISTDAGRFLCNFIYYQSLHFSTLNKTHSLFVHVPDFSVIDEPTQLAFVRQLLIHITDTLPK